MKLSNNLEEWQSSILWWSDDMIELYSEVPKPRAVVIARAGIMFIKDA